MHRGLNSDAQKEDSNVNKENRIGGYSPLAIVFSLTSGSGVSLSADQDTHLSATEVYYLEFMREEEKLARDVYIEMYELWGLPVFSYISESEQRHMDAVKRMLDAYGLVDPVEDENAVGVFQSSELAALYTVLIDEGERSLMSALRVGALIEEVDIEDIQHAIDATDQEDIRSVYESLLCGSRNHLRAFVYQIESNGGVFETQIFTDEEGQALIDSILENPMERDCGSY